MKKLLQSLFVLLFLAISAHAQNRTITGTVTSREDGLPLPGVSVKIKGTSTGVATSADGKFTLVVPSNTSTLEITSLGYVTQSVNVGTSNTINVSLESSSKVLSEVVVTGYGVVNKKDFTGSASRVSGDAIKDRPVQSFTQGLTGQAAGVSIVQPNGLLNNAPVIRVRGVSSVSLNSFPLVIVDGIPFPTGDLSANSSTNNPLGDINPADIESIDILKDAASTAIYGSRAAAGVLVITTKKGKTGSAKVSYDGWYGTNKAVRLAELLNAQQYMDVKNTGVTNALALNPSAVTAAQHVGGKSFFPTLNPDGSVVDTRWYDVVYRTAESQNHNVTVSGATDKTSYYISGGISDQNGFLKANTFKRYSGRVNLTHKATNWLSLNLNMNFNNSQNASPNSGSAPGGAFASSGLGRIAVALSPNLPVRNADGSYNYTLNNVGNGANLLTTTWSHPGVLIEQDRNNSENTRFLTNLGAEVKIVEGLVFKSTFSWDKSYTENVQFWNPYQGDGYSFVGYAYNNLARRNNWNLINTLQYNTSINGVHNFNVQVGSDVQKTRTINWGAVRQGLADPSFFNTYQGTFTTNLAGGNGINQIAFEAYIASASYNYNRKYFLSANFRRDGNSGLAFENRWGNFGGGSAAWELAEEDFFKNSSLGKTINSFRIRASYGKVGNGNVGSYNEFTTFGSGLYGPSSLAWSFNQAGNKELKWETSNQSDIGLTIGMLNNRLTIEADYFNKDINNLILGVPQASSKGVPGNNILQNVGSMYNKGFEFAISGSPIKTGKFSWDANINFTMIKNRVTALAPGVANLISATSGLESASITLPGYSIAGIYAVQTRGVNPANGLRVYVNKAGKEVQYQHHGGANAWTYVDGSGRAPAISAAADASYAGNTLPTWYGGFNNNFKYENFDLAMTFTYSGGNYIYNGSRAGLLDQRFWNNSVEALTAWKVAGDQTRIPRIVYGDNVSNGSSFPITENVEKGDFLRLQNVTLGYRLPTSLFGKSGINSIRVYGQINNAFLITNYTGVDPEISTNGNSNLASGVERNSIPQGRAFTFGISLGL
jgi:TonB-linked SusC/RagA family outer membrane protein